MTTSHHNTQQHPRRLTGIRAVTGIAATVLALTLTSACGTEAKDTGTRQQVAADTGSRVGLGSPDAVERRLASAATGARIGLGSPDAIERRLGRQATERRCLVSADSAERRGPDACWL